MPPCARSTSVLLESDSLTERSLAAGGHACVAAASRDAGSRPPRAERPRRRARPPAGRRPPRLGRASRQSWLGGRRPLRSAPLLGALAPVPVLDAMVSTPVAALQRCVAACRCTRLQVRGLAKRAWEERRDSARLQRVPTDSGCLPRLQKWCVWAPVPPCRVVRRGVDVPPSRFARAQPRRQPAPPPSQQPYHAALLDVIAPHPLVQLGIRFIRLARRLGANQPGAPPPAPLQPLETRPTGIFLCALRST